MTQEHAENRLVASSTACLRECTGSAGAVCFFLKKFPGQEWLPVNERYLGVHIGKGMIYSKSIEWFLCVDIFESSLCLSVPALTVVFVSKNGENYTLVLVCVLV